MFMFWIALGRGDVLLLSRFLDMLPKCLRVAWKWIVWMFFTFFLCCCFVLNFFSHLPLQLVYLRLDTHSKTMQYFSAVPFFFCVVSSWLFNSIAAGANAIRRNVSYEWEFLLLFFFIIERCFTLSSALAKVLRNLCATEQLRFRVGFCCLQARKTRFTRCLIDTQCNAASATDERTIVEQ